MPITRTRFGANKIVRVNNKDLTVWHDQAEQFTLQKTWVATSSSADYTYYSPAGSAFNITQNPWANGSMAGGDLYNCEAWTGDNGSLRLRNLSGPLAVATGNVKGSPSLTFGDHFHTRSSVRPLGDGVWSDTISELKVSVGGSVTTGTTGPYAKALQIVGFRSAYTGNDWEDGGNTLLTYGDIYNIQIRFNTNGAFPRYGGGTDVHRGRYQLGGHLFDVYRTNGMSHLTGYVSIGFVYVGDVHELQNVDMLAIINHSITDTNDRIGRSDTKMWVRGVEAWIETISGTTDITLENMAVRYNGVTYGVPPPMRAPIVLPAPVGYWPLNEGTGTSADDASANSNVGTISGATWVSSWLRGSTPCLSFNGTSNQVNVPDNAALTPSGTDVSFAFWTKLTQQASTKGTDQIWLYKNNPIAPLFSYQIYQRTSDNKVAAQWTNEAGSSFTTVTTNTVSHNMWVHICYVKSGATGKIYINGRDDTATSNAATGNMFNSTGNLVIGGLASKYVHGLMCEIRLYDRALSEAEVKALCSM